MTISCIKHVIYVFCTLVILPAGIWLYLSWNAIFMQEVKIQYVASSTEPLEDRIYTVAFNGIEFKTVHKVCDIHLLENRLAQFNRDNTYLLLSMLVVTFAVSITAFLLLKPWRVPCPKAGHLNVSY